MRRLVAILLFLSALAAHGALFEPFTTGVQATTPASEAWTDLDLTGTVASGASGVAIVAYDDAGSGSNTYGVRPNGNTTVASDTLSAGHSSLVMVKLDANLVIEVYGDTAGQIEYWVVGYFGDGAVFFQNPPDVSGATADAWNDIDVTSDLGGDAGSVAAVIVSTIHFDDGADTGYGLRNNGSSTAAITTYAGADRYMSFIVGIDVDEVFEIYGDSTADLAGYILTDQSYVEIDPPEDRDTTTDDAFTDDDVTSVTSSDASAVFMWRDPDGFERSTVRKNGGTGILFPVAISGGTSIVGLDASQIYEYYTTDNVGGDFHLLAYFGTVDETPPVSSDEDVGASGGVLMGRNYSKW